MRRSRAVRRGAAWALAGVVLAAPAAAFEFRVDAEPGTPTIMRRPCETGPCCNTCHAGQPAPDKKPPKHDAALYRNHLAQVGEGTKLPVGRNAYVTRQKGDLVLYEGDTRTVLPRSSIVLKDADGHAVLVLTEGVIGPR
jgi:hypothetical protein